MASLIHAQFDGDPSLFSSAGFMPTQFTQIATDASPFSHVKSRGPQRAVPVTVKQIAEAFHSSDDKSNLSIDGIDVANVRLLGMVMNKVEGITNVSFTLDDGTGRININRWVNEASDVNDLAVIQNWVYVQVHAHLKGFQGKRHAFAFSVQPVSDFNDIVLHFIECMHVHLEHTKQKGGFPFHFQPNPRMGASFAMKGYQAPITNQLSVHSGMSGSATDICNLVLGVLQEPENIAHEHGLHVDDVARRLGIPKNTIMEAINYHVDVGHIYSTIDEYHFKSACNV